MGEHLGSNSRHASAQVTPSPTVTPGRSGKAELTETATQMFYIKTGAGCRYPLLHISRERSNLYPHPIASPKPN